MDDLLDTLGDDQVEIVRSFATALRDGRAVVASRSIEEAPATGPDREPAAGA